MFVRLVITYICSLLSFSSHLISRFHLNEAICGNVLLHVLVDACVYLLPPIFSTVAGDALQDPRGPPVTLAQCGN